MSLIDVYRKDPTDSCFERMIPMSIKCLVWLFFIEKPPAVFITQIFTQQSDKNTKREHLISQKTGYIV